MQRYRYIWLSASVSVPFHHFVLPKLWVELDSIIPKLCLLQRHVRCRAPPAQGPAASGPCVGQAGEQERGGGLRCEQGCVPSSIVASAAVSPDAGTDGGQGAAFRRQRAAQGLGGTLDNKQPPLITWGVCYLLLHIFMFKCTERILLEINPINLCDRFVT